jgi:cytochrome b involved in lipid metabolism
MPVKTLTWDEFKREVAEEKAQYTVINGRVYDLSPDFLQWHPGGPVAATQVSLSTSCKQSMWD